MHSLSQRSHSVLNLFFALGGLAILLQGCASGSGGQNLPDPTLISIVVTPKNASVVAGNTQQFTATGTFSDSSTQNLSNGVTWTLSGSGCSGAACGTLTNVTTTSVTYNAPSAAPSPATVTLTATSVADSTKSSAATITVTPPVTVSVGPTSASVQTGQPQNFTATVTNDTQNKGVTWALSGSGCSGTACGTLSASSSASGVAITYTAQTTVPSPATVTLTATSAADTTRKASATITITAPLAIVVTVSPTTPSVQAGIGTQGFTSSLQNDTQNKGVTWTLSGSGCAGSACGTLTNVTTSSATYKAPSTVPSPATVTVTATSVADTTKSSSATITLTSPVAVSVAPAIASVQTSQPQNFTATVSNDAQNKGVTWALSGSGCSGTACGTLSASSSFSGVAITYTAPTTAPATVTLTATSAADTTRTASATITVLASTGNIAVSVTPKRGALTIAQSLTFSATVSNDGLNQGVTWSATGGSFSKTSSASGTPVTFTAPSAAGVYTVTATSVSDGTKSAAAALGVTDLTAVSTYHNDLARDGTNTKEYALSPTNVTQTTFGKLFSCPVDAPLYAQPLWVANLSIAGGTHNVIFVASVHDTVYAFDADTNPCVTLWQKSLLGSGETWVTSTDVAAGDIVPDIGIIGTPVIDTSTNTFYVVSKSKNSGSSCSPTSSCHQRLHALSLIDGSDKVMPPVDLTTAISVSGTGDGSSGGNVPFDPLKENQRPGLALVNGVVYAAWASHGDNGPYHGWILGFDKTSLARVATYNTSPNGRQGGIWMSGGAPAADSSNNLYVITGNGDYNGTSDFGDSFLKLSTTSGLLLTDWFTPYDQATLDSGDQDLGAGGAVVLIDLPSTSPVQHLLIGGGKAGEIYVLNRDNLGHNQASNNSQIVQSFPLGPAIFSTATFWNDTLYMAGVGGQLRAYAFNPANSTFNTNPIWQSSSSFGFPGSTPSVSSSGSTNGIVWALDNSKFCTILSTACGPAVLHAYNALVPGTELWNSSQASGNRDTAGNAVKFTVPTVANGKVYVGTRGNNAGGNTSSTTVPGELDVYGLLLN